MKSGKLCKEKNGDKGKIDNVLLELKVSAVRYDLPTASNLQNGNPAPGC